MFVVLSSMETVLTIWSLKTIIIENITKKSFDKFFQKKLKKGLLTFLVLRYPIPKLLLYLGSFVPKKLCESSSKISAYLQ